MMHPDEVAIMVEWSVLALQRPAGLCAWDRFGEIVGPADVAFLTMLGRTKPGDEIALERLKKAGNQVVLAWKRATQEYQRRQAQ